MMACENGHLSTVKVLCDKDNCFEHIEATTMRKASALSLAAMKQKEEIVQYLGK
jgi:hypothetical protein